MSNARYSTLCAVACGVGMAAFWIWSLAMAYADNPVAAIPLGIVAVFLSVAMRVNLHDRRIALIRADWRREADAHEQSTNPAGTGNHATRDAG